MKSIIQIIILIHCATVSLAIPQLNAEDLEHESTISYPQSDPRLKLTVVIGSSQKEQIEYFKNVALESARIVEDIFKTRFRDSFSVVFDPRYDYHNGLATVLPNNRIYIYTEVPNLESSIGLVKQAHLETTVHEMGHMMMLQQRRGVFGPLSWAIGNLSRPNMLFPRWVHEGMAVWTESHLGGRGQSGIIDAEIRKYAEYYHRNQKHPLRTDLLDGSLELNTMQPGNMPYHFGYLLIDDLLKDKNSKSAGELVTQSSSLPGLFFHRLFKKNGKIMTDRFNALRESWAKTPIEKGPENPTYFEAPNISGPFVSDKGLSWLYTEDKRLLYNNPVVYLRYQGEKNEEISTKFSRGGSRIVQSLWSQDLGAWILLNYSYNINSNSFLNKNLYLVSKSGELLCENSQIKRIRELAIDGSTLAWIRSDEKGLSYFEKAKITKDCKVSSVETILTSEIPYERFSHPWIKGKDWLISRSHGNDLSSDYIQGNKTRFVAPEGALGHPQLIGEGAQRKLLVSWYKKSYRGPALVNLQTQEIKIFPQKTEAPSSYALGNSVYANTELWEKDRVEKLALDLPPQPVMTAARKALASLPDTSKVAEASATTTKVAEASATTTKAAEDPTAATSEPTAASEAADVSKAEEEKTQIPIPELDPKAETSSAATPLHTYNAIPSIFPHFWYPFIASDDRGTIFSGSTYFTDLSGKWTGTALIGFDTGTQRPVADLFVGRQQVSNGMLDQIQFAATSDARFVGTQVQDIQIAQLQFRLTQRLNSRFLFAALPGAEFRHGSSTRSFKKYSVGAPSLGFLFTSPHARNIKKGNYQITQLFDAFYLNTQTRWLPEASYEIRANYQGSAGPLGYVLGLEYGNTPAAAFPKVYYEWGGRAAVSTLDSGFLARGFPSSIGPALEILRGHAEFGFKVWSPQRGLAWNRMHLTDIELRPVYEVVTSDLYRTTASGVPRKTSIQMGSDYFHSAGIELDVFFQALHYMDLKASIGYVHGVGNLGEENFGL